MFLLPHPQGQGSSLGGCGRQGQEAVPIPGPLLVPHRADQVPSTRGFPEPPTLQLPKAPRLSLDIIAFLPLCGEGLDCPRQASLRPTAPGHCPLGVASHEVSPEKAASDRGSGAGAGCLQVPSQKFRQDPQLHATPLAGACVD